MKSPPEKNRWSLFLALALAGLLTPGCISRETAARMIVEAPNRHYSPSPPRKLAEFCDEFSDGRHGSPFIQMRVITGPPTAEIAIVELPPGDYHLQFISSVHTNWDGKKFLAMKFRHETNRNFTPLKEPATIVVLHGYMMFKEMMTPWAAALARAGFRVVLVDLRGHGKSTGDQVTYGKYEVKDLSRVLDYLTAQGLCDEKVGVLGLSYGATLAMHWAAADQRVKAVVAIAPYNDPEEAAIRLAKELKIPVSRDALHGALADAADRLDLKWKDWSGEVAMRKLTEPVLLISGKRDRICLPADIEALIKVGPPGTKRIEVPEANHFVVGFWLPQLAAPVNQWFLSHLESAGETPAPIAIDNGEPKPKPN